MIVSRPSHAIIPEAFKFTTTTAKIESHSFGSVKLPEKTYTSDVPHGAALGSATEQQPRINSKGTGGSGSSSNNSGIATQQQHQVTLRTAAAPQQTTNSASSTSVRPTAGASVPDNNKMSVAYEHRTFIHDGSYPPMGEPAGDAGVEIKAGGVEGNGGGYPSPTDVVAELANYAAGADAAAAGGIVDASSSTAPAPTNGTEAASAPRPSKPATQREDGSEAAPAIRRIRAIPKPDREVKQDAEGKYCCTHEGCTDETRKFSRKCEWR